MAQSLAPFAFLALGALLVFLAPLLSVEYRRVFLTNPRSILSAKVLAKVVGVGKLGYVAVASLIAGALLLVAGIVLFALLAWIPVSN